MSSFAQQRGLDVDQVKKAGGDIRTLTKKYADLATDVALAAGGALPPPAGTAADAASLCRSLAKGDWWGAAFDVIGFIPLAGDAAKGGRIAWKLNDLRRVIDQTVTGMARIFRKTEDTAAAFWRSRKNMEAYREALRGCNGTVRCLNNAALKKGPQYRNTPISGGRWRPPNGRGDGDWVPDEGSDLYSHLRSLDPPRTSIAYENGFPKFDEFSQADIKIPMTGNHDYDFDIADDLYRKELGNPDWERPGNMTWHHKEDGTTMQLVPRDLNSNAGHMGGAALMGDAKVGQEF